MGFPLLVIHIQSGPGLSSSFEWATFSKSCPQLQRVWKLKDNKGGAAKKAQEFAEVFDACDS